MSPCLECFVDTSDTCTADRPAEEQIVAQCYYMRVVPCQEWPPSLEQGIEHRREYWAWGSLRTWQEV